MQILCVYLFCISISLKHNKINTYCYIAPHLVKTIQGPLHKSTLLQYLLFNIYYF